MYASATEMFLELIWRILDRMYEEMHVDESLVCVNGEQCPMDCLKKSSTYLFILFYLFISFYFIS